MAKGLLTKYLERETIKRLAKQKQEEKEGKEQEDKEKEK